MTGNGGTRQGTKARRQMRDRLLAVLGRRESLWALLLMATAAAAFLVTRSPSFEGLDLSEGDLGKPVRRAVIVPRTVHLKDTAAIERRKRDAERTASVVYQYDPEVSASRIQVVRESFAKMRQALVEGQRRIDAEVQRIDRIARGSGTGARAEGVQRAGAPDGRVPEREADLVERGSAAAVGSAAVGAHGRLEGSDDGQGSLGRIARGVAADAAQAPSVRALRTKYLEEVALARVSIQRLLRIDDDEYNSFLKHRFSIDLENRLIQLIGFAAKYLIPDDPLRLYRETRRVVVIKGTDPPIDLERAASQYGQVFDAALVHSKIQSEAAPKALEGLDAATKYGLISLGQRFVAPNLTYSEIATRALQERLLTGIDAAPLFVRVTKGQILVRANDILTSEKLRLIQGLKQEDSDSPDFATFLGNWFLLFLLSVVVIASFRLNLVRALPNIRDVVLVVATLLVMVAGTRFSIGISDALWLRYHTIPLVAFYYLVPVAAGAMLIRMLVNSRLAILYSFVFALLVGLLFQFNFFFVAYVFIGSLAAAALAAHAKNRTGILRAGLITGLVQAGLTVAFALLAGAAPAELLTYTLPENHTLFETATLLAMGAAMVSGLLSSFVVAAVVPIAELTFGYMTDVKLLELANLNHPLLKKLIIEAPGTYHHSMVVGNLVEAGAEAIGANPLLGRVGCYYHDLGKTKNPEYFAENQRRGENPHDHLTPSMSALVIKAHVKDGAEIARDSGIAQPIVDFIEQHHGTTLISYFYRRAVEITETKGEGERIQESDYRYPGPKPQTRETGIAMLADSIEAAARTIDDPSPSRLQGLVQKVINMKFTDGQLDECDLTLRDLHEIAKAFLRVLVGVYHQRPKYQASAAKEASPALRAIQGGDPKPEHYAGEDLKRLGNV